MDIKIIINAFILIFILHIIIINLNYTKNIGQKRTKTVLNNLENFDNSEKKSLDFLIGNDNKNEKDSDFQKKLMNYIQQPVPIEKTKFEQKNKLPVEACNSFLSDNNEPNFESNVANISKFYNINYDNMDENTLKSTSLESLQKVKELEIETISKQINNINDINKKNNEEQVKSPFNVQHYGRDSTQTPDNWLYKDELPMNGGIFGSIVGFDQLESQFAMYNPNKLNLEKTTDTNFNNIPHDDLRKPVIYEN
jgi:hypothetical protein